jgi:hypothetical protein
VGSPPKRFSLACATSRALRHALSSQFPGSRDTERVVSRSHSDYTSHCHQPPRSLFPERHQPPRSMFKSVTSGPPFEPHGSLQYRSFPSMLRGTGSANVIRHVHHPALAVRVLAGTGGARLVSYGRPKLPPSDLFKIEALRQ